MSDIVPLRGLRLEAATVDHGLRPEARAEAIQVAQVCAGLRVPHMTLTWEGWTGTGNLQAEARAARTRLLAQWGRARELSAICLGHTQDDQAETLLLRLMRGSGVDGLAAMAARSDRADMVWLRPLLDTRRADLRDMLRAEGIAWAEDPGNADSRYDRVRVRQVIDALDMDVPRLADTAAAMARARVALGLRAAEAAEAGAVRFDHGDILLDTARMQALDPETRLRLLAEALRWVAGAAYRPRIAALEAVWNAARAGRRATLHGCTLLPRAHHLRVCREFAAVADHETPLGADWDGRWRLSLPDHPAATVKALGQAGLSQITRPKDGPPQASLLVTPAIWDGPRVLSVPRLNWGLSGRIDTSPSPLTYRSRLIQH
jgi:tRNA(Ile)-lysidine synthase